MLEWGPAIKEVLMEEFSLPKKPRPAKGTMSMLWLCIGNHDWGEVSKGVKGNRRFVRCSKCDVYAELDANDRPVILRCSECKMPARFMKTAISSPYDPASKDQEASDYPVCWSHFRPMMLV